MEETKTYAEEDGVTPQCTSAARSLSPSVRGADRDFADIFSFVSQYDWIHDLHLTKFLENEVWNCMPAEWTSALSAMSVEELNLLPFHSCPASATDMSALPHPPPNCPASATDMSALPHPPPSLARFLQRAAIFSQHPQRGQRVIPPPLQVSREVKKGMSPKKLHEVERLASLVHQVAVESGCTVVVDVGSGLGYLGQVLHQAYGLTVIGVECSTGHSEGAERRAAKQGLTCSGIRSVPFLITQDEDSVREFCRLVQDVVSSTEACQCRCQRACAARQLSPNGCVPPLQPCSPEKVCCRGDAASSNHRSRCCRDVGFHDNSVSSSRNPQCSCAEKLCCVRRTVVSEESCGHDSGVSPRAEGVGKGTSQGHCPACGPSGVTPRVQHQCWEQTGEAGKQVQGQVSSLRADREGDRPPQGCQQHPSGQQQHPSGQQQHPSGQQQHPSGQQQHPSGQQQHPSGQQQHPSGQQQHPSGQQQHPSGQQQQPSGQQQHPSGQQQHPSGQQQHPSGQQQQPSGQQQQPSGQQQHPSGQQQHPSGQQQHPSGQQQQPSGQQQHPSGQQQQPSGQQQHPSGQQQHPSGQHPQNHHDPTGFTGVREEDAAATGDERSEDQRCRRHRRQEHSDDVCREKGREKEGEQVGEKEEVGVCLIGLHCCGDLTPAMLRLYRSVPFLRALCCVSCCYHKMQLQPGSEEQFINFPMSAAAKTAYAEVCTHRTSSSSSSSSSSASLSSSSTSLSLVSSAAASSPSSCVSSAMTGAFWSPCTLRLAAQETRVRWMAQTEEDHSSHTRHVAYRALLHLLFKKTGTTAPDRKTMRRLDYTTFDNFVQSYVTALNKQEEGQAQAPQRVLETLHEQYKDCFRHIEPFTCLQVALQPVLERAILHDRQQWLMEQGLTSDLLPIFDEALSPRNLALVSVKSCCSAE